MQKSIFESRSVFSEPLQPGSGRTGSQKIALAVLQKKVLEFVKMLREQKIQKLEQLSQLVQMTSTIKAQRQQKKQTAAQNNNFYFENICTKKKKLEEENYELKKKIDQLRLKRRKQGYNRLSSSMKQQQIDCQMFLHLNVENQQLNEKITKIKREQSEMKIKVSKLQEHLKRLKQQKQSLSKHFNFNFNGLLFTDFIQSQEIQKNLEYKQTSLQQLQSYFQQQLINRENLLQQINTCKSKLQKLKRENALYQQLCKVNDF